MLHLANNTKESDDILNMLSSARRQSKVEIPSNLDGVYHRAMSRRKSQAQEDLQHALSFLSSPEYSEVDDNATSSSSYSDSSSGDNTDDHDAHSHDHDGENENKSENDDAFVHEKPDDNEKDSAPGSPEIKIEIKGEQKEDNASPTYERRYQSKRDKNRLASFSSRLKSARKVPFLKTRSASSNNLKPKARFERMGRRLSLSNILTKTSETNDIDTADQQAVGKTRSRRASLPVLSTVVKTSMPAVTETVPEAEEPADPRSRNTFKSRTRRTRQKFSELRSKRIKSTSVSSSESSSESEKETAGYLPSDTVDLENKMAMGVNDAFENITSSKEPDDKKERRSVRNVLKNNFFRSMKSKKINSVSQPSVSSVQEDPAPPREFKRRTSRLEMGVPIEEIFAGIEFKTVNQSTVSIRNSEEDEFVDEDPDALVNALELERQRKKSKESQDGVSSSLASLTIEKSMRELVDGNDKA